jgi:Serine carboxypeptidase
MLPLSDYVDWKDAGCSVPNPPAECTSRMNDMVSEIGPLDDDDLYTDLLSGNATLGLGPVPEETIQKLTHNWLNRPDVQSAIHAMPSNWSSCCSEAGQSGSQCKLNYTNNWTDMLPYYDEFFAKTNLRIWIYSGDVDIATCPFAYAQLCIRAMNRPLITKWHRWVMDGQTAGYTESYDKLTYVTIKGAGHEAPMFAPRQAYQVAYSFVTDTPL